MALAATGAAISDFLNIARRRAPWVRIIINPVRVQGVGAAGEIAAAIREFTGAFFEGQIDLLVVCRGGGSMEDLWAFNEEAVARAIADSRIPVISAVGHEIDFTIADFVADLRAPTPSAAAELALPDRAALVRSLALARSRLSRALENLLQDHAQRLDAVAALIEMRRERALRVRKDRLAALLAILRQHRPDQLLALRRLAVDAQRRKLEAAARAAFTRKASRLAQVAGVLRVLSPDATLARGYTITFDSAGSIVRGKDAVRSGDQIRTRLADGEIDSRVL